MRLAITDNKQLSGKMSSKNKRYLAALISTFWHLEAVALRFSVKMLFLENPQNSQENTCARVFF